MHAFLSPTPRSHLVASIHGVMNVEICRFLCWGLSNTQDQVGPIHSHVNHVWALPYIPSLVVMHSWAPTANLCIIGLHIFMGGDAPISMYGRHLAHMLRLGSKHLNGWASCGLHVLGRPTIEFALVITNHHHDQRLIPTIGFGYNITIYEYN